MTVFHFLKSTSNDVTDVYFMYTSNDVTPLGNVFEAMMEKGQDQIPDEGFLMTKMPMYYSYCR